MGVKRRIARGARSVRRFNAEDTDAVIAIVEASPQAATWSGESYREFREERGSLALVFETNGEVSGFLVGRQVEDQAEVLNLAVKTEQRRKGEGGALLGAALEEFRSGGAKSVYLEVRQSNTGAIAFYQKHGFAQTGRRKGYYREPDEAAMTMTRKLTG